MFLIQLSKEALFYFLLYLLQVWRKHLIFSFHRSFYPEVLFVGFLVTMLNLKVLPFFPMPVHIISGICELRNVNIDSSCALNLSEICFEFGIISADF